MTVRVTAPRDVVVLDLRSTTFATMWAMASVIHLVNQSAARMDDPAGWFNLLAAVAVLRRPSSALRLAVLAGSQLIQVAWTMPLAADHVMLAAAVDALLLLSVAHAARARSSADGSTASYLTWFAGPARVALLIAYSAAAVAKYNQTFLDPTTSCAVFLADVATFGLSTQVAAMAPAHIAVAVIIESLIPLLLVVPMTRSVGARIGIVFHFLVSLSPAMQVGDFSAVLWPLFMLFLTEGEQEAMARRMHDMLSRSRVVQRLRSVGFWPAGALLVAAAGAVGWIPGLSDLAVRIALALLVFVYGTVVVTAALRTRPAHTPTRRIAGRPGIGAVVVLAALVIWCLNPYLGFRTTGSFTMFSNLRTEGPGTNHLFMPSLHLVPHQNDLVVLDGSDDDDLQELAESGQALPYLEVQRLAADGVAMTARRRGDLVTVPAGGGREVPAPDPVLAKLWHFRPVPVRGAPQCTN